MKNYFEWLVENTPTTWWHDSGDLAELEFALNNRASGVTTNPPLIASALRSCGQNWKHELAEIFEKDLQDDARSIELTGVIAKDIASRLSSVYREGAGQCKGFVCAQVNPALMGDRESMLAAARLYAKLAPNISVKVPATKAGLEVAEICIVEGISITVTVSFTVAQVLAIGEMYERAMRRAAAENRIPGTCCAVVMIGRVDDYLRNIAADLDADVSESDIRQAGIAIVKRAYGICKKRGYKSKLCVAALRGPYHMTELAGADIIVSVHPKQQQPLLVPDIPKETRIDIPVEQDVLERLNHLPEFRKAYEPDGLAIEEFLSYGATQFTLSQFIESGWKQIRSFRLEDCKELVN